METRHSVCVFCDGGCPITAKVAEGHVDLSPSDPAFPAICSKAHMWEDYRSHPGRILKPLKNIGERGNPVWTEVPWDDALDEIALRLKSIIEKYGAESFACSETPLNTGFGGITRRFMNHLGSPNYITPVLLCMGNTAQIHRATYGWFTVPDWGKADLIVYFGQNRGMELWPVEYLKLRKALDRGARLIVIDPRITETSQLADYHVRLRYGTDAAFLLAWINVIIEEGLFDRDFVENKTIGFTDLCERASHYTPEAVSAICGIPADAIRETARMYANAEASIIPWGVVGDMQKNSTSFLRCQCILRALCGYISVSEYVLGPSEGAYSNSQIADYGSLPATQKAKQIGVGTYPLFSFKGMGLYDNVYEAAGMDHTPDLFASSCVAHPASLFRAMASEDPYPVKAFFSIGNNTVMSYAGQQEIIKGFMNQELVVVFEHFMTPTAQLADFILPGDMWLERGVVGPQYDFAPVTALRQQLLEPAGESKDWYSVVKGLADRLDLEEAFPWKDHVALYDYILSPHGVSWAEAQERPSLAKNLVAAGSFLTPSGKVELRSSVLEKLGHDPLPYYIEPVGGTADEEAYPFVIFSGAREKTSYNTNLHQIPRLRERDPEPLLYINPEDLSKHNLLEGRWACVTTSTGLIELLVKADDCQPAGTIRVPHGWWKPEAPQGLDNGLSGACLYNDGMVFSGQDWNLDREQGLPNLRGGIRAAVAMLDR